jgi:hypothetical protein
MPGRTHFAQSREVNSIFLQHTIGNQAAQWMLQTDAEELKAGLTGSASPHFGHDFSRIPIHPLAEGAIQTKSAITKPGDEYEQEADRVAEQVMRLPEPQLQRASVCREGCPKCQMEELGHGHERLHLERVGSGHWGQTELPPMVHEVTRSSGQTLDPAVRGFMEPRFRCDFSRVRIHTDSVAASSAHAVNANAYTLGQHIVFDFGQYAPASNHGKRLLAHELAHVAQQHSGAWPLVARQTAPPPPQVQGQPGSGRQHTCSELNLSALKLPRQNNNGAQFFEETSKDIRFLVAAGKGQASAAKGKINQLASHIDRLNLLIADPSSKVKLVIVTEGTSEHRSLCGQPVLIIDPKEFNAQTVVHETVHGVTDHLRQQSQGTSAQAANAKNFLDKATDIFLQLSGLTIEVSPGNPMTATNLVDPSILNSKELAEHPGTSVDEFLASAVAAYLLNRKRLEKKIQEFGNRNPRVMKAGNELMELLGALTGTLLFPKKPLLTGTMEFLFPGLSILSLISPLNRLTSDAKSIADAVKNIQSTPAVDEKVLATHGLLTELLFP